MNQDTADLLRREFDKKQIGKLPRVTCKACSQGNGQCGEHKRAKCRQCSAYVSSQHIHLDYVGHAAVTDRLLQADPDWTWEPMAFAADGLPAFDRNGGLWIRLTVAGTTKIGYGDAQGKNGPNAVKETIGDAIRNAAMRFGVALDLWAKEDLSTQRGEKDEAQPETEHPVERDPQPESRAEMMLTANLRDAINAAPTLDALSGLAEEVKTAYAEGRLGETNANALNQLGYARQRKFKATVAQNGEAP